MVLLDGCNVIKGGVYAANHCAGSDGGAGDGVNIVLEYQGGGETLER